MKSSASLFKTNRFSSRAIDLLPCFAWTLWCYATVRKNSPHLSTWISSIFVRSNRWAVVWVVSYIFFTGCWPSPIGIWGFRRNPVRPLWLGSFEFGDWVLRLILRARIFLRFWCILIGLVSWWIIPRE